jgi:glycerol-3-phosphate dehydrogenase
MQEQPQQPDVQPLDGMPEEEQQRYKTVPVKLEEGTHAQLRFIAQLSGNSIADEIRRSVDARIVAAQDDADLIARAEQVRQEIEREAAARSAAIAGFLGQPAVAEATDSSTASPTRPSRRKSASE